MVFYFSLMKVLFSVHVDVRLLWADSLPHCTGLLYRPAMLKMVKTLASTKTLASAYNSLIFAKLQQSLSLLKGILSKSGKHINAHHHCQISVFILTVERGEVETI
jgi:hypothetical protein